MKIFITGITGFVGRHLVEYLSERNDIEIYGCARSLSAPGAFPVRLHYTSLDLVDKEALLLYMQQLRPSLIIHAAATSRPNDCELDHELCNINNIAGTQNIVEAANAIHARLLFLSSDMVFANDGPYREDDLPCPLNYYGQTKARAEQLLTDSSVDYAIIRTVLVYGKKLPGLKNGFLQWVDENIRDNKTIRVFTDQYRTATYVKDLCKGIDMIAFSNEQGIFHICGEQVFTPYEIAVAVAKFQHLEKAFIQPITNADMQEAAVRPSNCTLSISKSQTLFGYAPTPLEIALAEIFG